MRSLFAILVSLLFSLPALSEEIVFDLDWTLLYAKSELYSSLKADEIVKFDGVTYRIADHVVDLLITLHTTPGIKVSYFSGGTAERDNFILSEIYKRIDKKTHTQELYRPFAVAHKDQMVPVKDAPPGSKFSDRMKKDLLKLHSGVDLNSTLLVDDIRGFTPLEQTRNQLWIETYDDVPEFERLADLKSQLRFAPPTRAKWWMERNKMLWVMGVVLEARDLSTSEKIPFVEAVQRVIGPNSKNSSGLWETSQMGLFNRGAKALGIELRPPCAVLLQ